LQGERAEYGKQVINQLAKELTEHYGKGWGVRQLRYCIRFAEVFNDTEIVHTVFTIELVTFTPVNDYG